MEGHGLAYVQCCKYEGLPYGTAVLFGRFPGRRCRSPAHAELVDPGDAECPHRARPCGLAPAAASSGQFALRRWEAEHRMLAAVVGTVMGPRQPANGEPPCLRTGAASALHRARQDAPAAWQAPGGHRHRWPCRPAGWYAVVPAPRHGTAVSSGHHAQRLRLEEMQDAGFRPRRAVPQPKPRQQVRQSAASCPAGRIPVPGGVPQHRRAGSALPGRKPAGCHQPVLPAPQPWHPAAASQLPEAREPVQAPFPTPQACDGATLTMPVAETVTAAQPPVRHRGACRRRAGHLSASPPAHRSRQQPYPIHPPPPATANSS